MPDDFRLSHQDVAELQQALANIDLLHVPSANSSGGMELLLARLGHLVVRIYQEKNHFRPHLHVIYKNEFKASYCLDTLERIVGEMPRRYEKTIQEWAVPRRPKITQVWNDLKTGRIPQYEVELKP